MSATVCLSPTNTLDYPKGGGHLWVYLNWALGLRALGCEVIWLETIYPSKSADEVRASVADLKSRLEPHGFAERVALHSWTGESLPDGVAEGCLDFEEAAAGADLLLNQRYNMSSEVVGRFRRSALMDIDPGLLQVWMNEERISVAPHDVYFTIGETVGQPGASFPDMGLEWHYTPPPVFLPAWPPARADSAAPYTTVSQWWGEWIKVQGEVFSNDKRTAFLEYLDLPSRTSTRLELALCLGLGDEEERRFLEERGWKIQHAWEVSSTPEQYHAYIQQSRGEFSCVKPSCVRLNNAWISDRTLCYLASGKPAVVQHTGPSRFLPDAEGLLRFGNLEEAARALSATESDYERHCRLARELAEEHFDAQKVVGRVLERALP